MHLLYPIGLIALAGLLIPLIIHLWKLKQGKTLRIGSIALLGASSPFTSRSYQITDWLLLFLRMLLIALLAFLLAEPYLKKEKGEAVQKGWVLLEKAQLTSIYKTHQQEVDSLMKAGYEMHDFGLGFQQLSLKDTLTASGTRSGSARDLSSGNPQGLHSGSTDSLSKLLKVSHYALLRELNAQLQPKFPVYLFADRKLQNLGGDQPQIDFRLIWKEIPGTDTSATWSSSFAHKTFEAKSSAGITTIKRLDEGQDAAKIKVLIYASEHPEDVNYLKAAIQAIAQETKRNVEVSVFNDQNNSELSSGAKGEGSFDVAFWISTKPVSNDFISQLAKEGRLFNYAGGKMSLVNSWIDVAPGSKGNMPAIPLSKRTTDSADQGEAIWTDGFGTPLLTRSKEKTFDQYRFYSRMNPQWTSLVWNEQFVEAMMPILLGAGEPDADFGFERNDQDQRKIAPSASLSGQSVPGKLVNNTVAAGNSLETITDSLGPETDPSGLSARSQQEQPLQKVFWILALLVFTLERIISLRHKNKANHG